MIVVDENVPNEVTDALEAAGLEVVRVGVESPTISDEAVLALAIVRKAVVLTFDKDFGDLVYRDGRHHEGVVLVRLRRMTDTERAQRVLAAFREYGDQFSGAFTVISDTGTRVRRTD